MLYAITVGPAKAKNFQLAEFIFSPGNGRYFRSANVQANNNRVAVHRPAIVCVLFVSHSCMFVCVCVKSCLFRSYLFRIWHAPTNYFFLFPPALASLRSAMLRFWH